MNVHSWEYLTHILFQTSTIYRSNEITFEVYTRFLPVCKCVFFKDTFQKLEYKVCSRYGLKPDYSQCLKKKEKSN